MEHTRTINLKRRATPWRMLRALFAVAFAAVLALAAPAYAQDDELLEPEKAFAFTAKRTSDDTISLSWKIADGYYMYQDKFKFEATGVKLGYAEFPKGKTKFDDFFGEVTTYENRVVIELPIAGSYTGETFSITAWGQGCNEPIGVCYPPLPNTIEFDTPQAVLAALRTRDTIPGRTVVAQADRQQTALAESAAENLEQDEAQDGVGSEVEASGEQQGSDEAVAETELENADEALADSVSDTPAAAPVTEDTAQAAMEPADESQSVESQAEPLMEPVIEPATEMAAEPMMEPTLDQPAFSAATPAATSPSMSSVDELRSLLGDLGSEQKEFLDVDVAFRLDVSANDDNEVVAHFDVEPGYYLYQNSLKFETTDSDVSVGRYSLPPGEPKTDEHFGDVIVYYGSFDVRVPVEGALAQRLNMKVSYQGCAEDGICYAPVEKQYQLAMVVPAAAEQVAVAESANAQALSATTETTEQKNLTLDAANDAENQQVVAVDKTADKIGEQTLAAVENKIEVAQAAASEKTGSGIVVEIKETRGVFDFWSYFKGYQFDSAFFGIMLASFGTGLLLTFTPCVLPMIPIVSSIVVGQGGGKARAGWLSLMYVLGTAVTYAVIGWVAGATGEQLQAYFQNIYAIGAIAVLFVVMALSMFGLFELQMPSFMQSRMQEKTAGWGGSTFMVFVLGIVSALIVGACVSPLLISVLSVALVKGDPVLGASMMFIMALGMGVVLVAVGLGSSWLLPRAGMWMDYVKYAFGVMLIAVAIYLLGAIPAVPVQLLWAALFIVLSVYLGATQGLPEGANGWRFFAKGVGIILLVWGVIALFGGLQGNRDIMHPLPDKLFSGPAMISNGAQNENAAHAEFVRVKNLDELNALRERAVAESKPLLLDYYADWCTDCIRMEETTFKDPGIVKALENYVLVQVDVTDPKDEDGKALKSEFNIYGPPATVIFDTSGKEIGGETRFYGYRNVAEMLAILDKV